MAFLSAGSNFVASPTSFGDILRNAPSIDSNLFSQVPLRNQEAAAAMVQDAFGAKAELHSQQMNLDQQRWLTKKRLEAEEDAAKKQAAMQMLSGLGSIGGGTNRFAGDALAGVLNDEESSPLQQLQTLNAIQNQVRLLDQQIGNASFGSTAAYTAGALKGT